MTPAEWKRFYERERAALSLPSLFDRAPKVRLPKGGALVFPHTKLEASGHLVAAVANAVVETGADRVLAIGVLHGRKGGERQVYATPEDEFSLDGFTALIELAAKRAGRTRPELICRYPLLVGDDPLTLPGLDELRTLVSEGCAVVATTDPIHHGAGYGTPASEWRLESDQATRSFAEGAIEEQTRALEAHDYPAFQRAAQTHRSDFRDSGPTLSAVLGTVRYAIHELVLVDYAETLAAAHPTWVAAALIVCSPDQS